MRILIGVLMVGLAAAGARGDTDAPDPMETNMAQRVTAYFGVCFEDLKSVAEQDPTLDTFRDAMEPVVKKTAGFFGGTLIDTNFVIRQVYFKRDVLARGFDLNKVKELKDFWAQMRKAPAPQLSEPGHGNIVQPRLVAMRYPVIVDGKLKNIVSMMVRTEAFLAATGLDSRPAFKIICQGKLAEEKGTLSGAPHTVKLQLPSTEWVIQFD